jgi:antitoxin ParD1/3/4
MPNMNVNLSGSQADFIKNRISSGEYRNADQVVCAGLRLLERREQEDKLKLRALRRMACEGLREIERGDYVTVDSADLDEFVAGLGRTSRTQKS